MHNEATGVHHGHTIDAIGPLSGPGTLRDAERLYNSLLTIVELERMGGAYAPAELAARARRSNVRPSYLRKRT